MESKLPNSIEELPQALKEAIQKLIDEKVQEKFTNFMGEYQEVLTKLKSTHKPTVPAKPINLKNKAGQESEDTPTSGKTPVSTGIKKPPPTSRPVTATKVRSDSKESSQSKDKSAEDKRKDAEQKKKDELEKKKVEAQTKKDELERKKKEEADKKKKQEERKTQSVPAKGQGKKGNEGDEDDPIDKSL